MTLWTKIKLAFAAAVAAFLGYLAFVFARRGALQDAAKQGEQLGKAEESLDEAKRKRAEGEKRIEDDAAASRAAAQRADEATKAAATEAQKIEGLHGDDLDRELDALGLLSHDPTVPKR